MATFDAAIKVLMAHEGTPTNYWVDDPADAGGETAWGWSMLTIKRLGLKPEDLGLKSFDKGALKALTYDKAVEMYKQQFWLPLYDAIADQTVATKVFDAAVNMSPLHAHECLQRAANDCGAKLEVDGKLGPLSIDAVNRAGHAIVGTYSNELAAYYRGRVAARPANAKFLNNWLARAAWGV